MDPHPLQDIRDDRRRAIDGLAEDYLLRRREGMAADAFFDDLRRTVEARAATLEQIAENGALGGGGPDEA